MGIEQHVYRECAPPDVAGRTAWYTSFGPEGREIISRDAWGGGDYAQEYLDNSPSRYCILPQIRLEPILRRRAHELNPDGVKYGHEVIGFDEGSEGVTVRVKTAQGVEKEVKARFVVAADGGRMVADRLGVPWVGERDVFKMVTAHVRAPISQVHPDPQTFITWFTHPEMGGSIATGYMYPVGPWPGNAETEEWIFACAVSGDDPLQFEKESMVARLKKTLRVPELEVEVISLSHWDVDAVYTEKYRVGRVFLVGDAAHRIPPWGALGMNTGIQDAQNLVWKLEMALKDEHACGELLDTYEEERLPIGRRVGLWSLQNLRSHGLIMDAALGMAPGKSAQENKEAIAPYFDEGHPEHAERRRAVMNAQKVLDSEFKAPGSEIGWFYPSADLNMEGGELHDGQLLLDGSLSTEFYVPTTVPGHHLPHAWLEKGDRRVAVRDLVPLSKLLLLVQGQEWSDLRGDGVQVEIIGKEDWSDVDETWRKICGGDEQMAVLVRPDGIIAWRGKRTDVAGQAWPRLLDRILCLDNQRAAKRKRSGSSVEQNVRSVKAK